MEFDFRDGNVEVISYSFRNAGVVSSHNSKISKAHLVNPLLGKFMKPKG